MTDRGLRLQRWEVSPLLNFIQPLCKEAKGIVFLFCHEKEDIIQSLAAVTQLVLMTLVKPEWFRGKEISFALLPAGAIGCRADPG